MVTPAPLPIYLINMDRSTDRLAQSQAAFAAIGAPFERVSGVDGRAEGGIHHPDYDRQRRLARWGSDMGAGSIGCYLSHVKAMKTGLAAGHDRFVVVEDDILPLETFREALVRVAQLPETFGLVRLYGLRKRPSLDLGALGPDLRLSLLLQGPNGTQGYAVTRAAAQAFVDHCSKAMHQIDTQFDRMWEWCGLGFIVEPFVIKEVPDLSAESVSAAVGRQSVQEGFVADASRNSAMKRQLLFSKWSDDALRLAYAARAYTAALGLKAQLAAISKA